MYPITIGDNRIFELYIVIKVLEKYFKNEKSFINRKELELNHLRRYNTPNNNFYSFF